MTTTKTGIELSAAEEDRAEALHKNSLVIDGSGVIAYEEEHFERTNRGGVNAVNHTVVRPNDGLLPCLSQINECRRWVDANSDRVGIALTATDIEEGFSNGIEQVIFGPQHSEFLGTDLSRLGTFYDLGVRIIQLTYQTRNWVGDGCGEPNPGGLSRFGHDLVKEMDALGVVIDLSHTSHPTSFDAIEAAAGPVLLTHAHPESVTPHPRAKSDNLLKAVADSGGVVGLTALSPFNSLQKGTWPGLAELRVHFDYLLDLIGPEHVGIGMDFDETISFDSWSAAKQTNPEFATEYTYEQRRIESLQDSSDIPNVTRVLVSIGLSDDEIRQILGLNILRVMKEVWT